jgi:hypothetical protein
MLRYPDGEPVAYAYGSQFTRRGVGPGDEVYLVSVHRGRVHLLSKMLVRAVASSADEFRRITGLDPEPAAEYLIAEAYTPARLVPLPDELARALRFVSGKELVGLAYREGAQVDGQCLRGVRRLSAESATALDELLPALVPYRPGEAARPYERADPGAGRRAVRVDVGAPLPLLAAPPGKTYAQVRKPNQVRFLAGMVEGVQVVVNLHKPGLYRHDNLHVARALRALAGAIERAVVPLADQDGELALEP